MRTKANVITKSIVICIALVLICIGANRIIFNRSHKTSFVEGAAARITDTWFNPPRINEYDGKITYKDVTATDYCVVGLRQEKRAISLLEKDPIIQLDEKEVHQYCGSFSHVKPQKGLTPFLIRSLSSVEQWHKRYSVRYSTSANILWVECLFAFKEAPWEATTNRKVYRQAAIVLLPHKPEKVLVSINEGIYE